MPKILLRYTPRPRSGGPVRVGTIDEQELHFMRGHTYWDGLREIEFAEIADDMLAAVDEALTPVFGGDWNRPLSVLAGLNARTVQRDRIVSRGLNGEAIILIGRVAVTARQFSDPRAFGDIVLGAARLFDPKMKLTPFGPRTFDADTPEARDDFNKIGALAVEIMGDYRRGLTRIRRNFLTSS